MKQIRAVLSLILIAYVFSIAVPAQVTPSSIPFAGNKASDPKCSRVGTIYWNTTDRVYKSCTATGTPGTWVEFGTGGGGGGGGTVTSVSITLPSIFSVTGSPITSSGNLSAALTSQSANRFFSAPSGSSGTPTFRAITAADLGTGTANSATCLFGNLTWGTCGGGGGSSTLTGLTDVQIASPVNGQILTYNSGTLKWVNQNAPTGGGGAGTYLSAYANLNAAITAIGSTATTLLVDRSESVTASVLIPTTLKITQTNGAQLTFTGAGSMNFAGTGLTDAMRSDGLLKVTAAQVQEETRDFYVNLAADTFTGDGHPFVTGQQVRYNVTAGLAASPLVSGEIYYVIDVNGTAYKLATSYANALSGTAINLTSDGGAGAQGIFKTVTLVFSGDAPTEIASELIDTGNDSSTDRIKQIVAAYGTKPFKVFVAPRVITTAVVFEDYQSIHFLAGEHDNQFNPNNSVNQYLKPFQMGSHSSFTADAGAVVYESNITGAGITPQTGIVTTKDGRTNVRIDGVHFKYNPGAVFNSSTTTAAIVNSTKSVIRNCWFEGNRAYHAGIIVSGYDGVTYVNNYDSYDNVIENNLSTGYVTQNYYIIGGHNNSIRFNRVMLKGAIMNAYSTIIDLEPNTQMDEISDSEIVGNYIDVRDVVNENSPYITVASTGFNATTNEVTATTLNLTGGGSIATGDVIQISDSNVGTVPTGLIQNDLQYYWAIVTGANIFKFASSLANANAGIAVDFTTTGAGNIKIEKLQPINTIGILVQNIYTEGIENVKINDNTILSYDDESVFPNYMSAGISADGGFNFEVARNHLVGNGVSLYQGRKFEIHDNILSGNFDLKSMAATKVYNNILQASWNTYVGGIFNEQAEINKPFTSNGVKSALYYQNSQHPEGDAWQYFKNLYVSWNEQLYKISAVSTNAENLFSRSITTDPVMPTVAVSRITETGFNAATDEITTSGSHGFETGAILFFIRIGGGDVVPTNLPDYRYYYVIKISATKFKLALNRDEALTGTAIDLAGSPVGTFDFIPTMQLRFMDADYSNNHADGGSKRDDASNNGYTLLTLGKSQILSTYTDARMTEFTGGSFNVFHNHGVLIFRNTIAATANLPTAVGIRGKTYVFKDALGNAATYSITIDAAGSETIDGAATKVISTNYGTARIRSDGANWFVVQ